MIDFLINNNMNTNIHYCDYGCGNIATHQFKNGTWCCNKYQCACPAVKKKNSIKRKKQFSENGVSEGLRKYYNELKSGLRHGWSKGLTKETNESVRKWSDTQRELYKTGKLKGYWEGKHLPDEIRKKISLKSGGYRRGSGRGKKGWYKGYWCDSSWELAWVIYNLEHDVSFSRNRIGFDYQYNNKTYKYYPDFIIDNTYYEIKGYMNDKVNAKIKSFPNKLIVLYKNDMKPYLEYVKKKYGKDFIKLYEKRASSDYGKHVGLKN